jgi:uncharacterized protein YdeI (YjbR/CyaY-like superfamily)
MSRLLTPTVQIPASEPFDWRVDKMSLDLPEELERTLEVNPEARRAFADWSIMQQWDVTWFIEEAADERTRHRRAEKALSLLERRLAFLGS